MTPRRAVVLPVVMLMLVLIALIGAMFAFHVHADVASMRAVETRLQTRLAAEAGVEYVKLMLRTARLDRARWYNNPEELNRVLVWGDGTAPQDWGLNRDWDDLGMAYRFSIVADDPTDDEEFARFGITDESSKLNLNKATPEQWDALVRLAVADDETIDPQAIVDAILDWTDPDSDPRGEEGDTEGEYYRSLPKPYLVKNEPFDSVEELLLVKGVTEQILYGEDRDRNGLMTPNENDGDHLFPPDNLDGTLNRGMYPYLTVHSSEKNVTNDNRPRTRLYETAEAPLREALAEALDEHGDWVDFVIQTRSARPRAGGKPPAKKPPGQGGKPPGQPGQDPGAPPEGDGSNPPSDGAQNPPGDAGGGSPNPPAGADGGGPTQPGAGVGVGRNPPTKPGAGTPPGTKPPGGKPPKPPKAPGGAKPPRNEKSSVASAKLQKEPGGQSPGSGPKGGGKKPPALQGSPPSAGSGAPPVAGEGAPPSSGEPGLDEGDGSPDQGDVGDPDSEQPKDDGAPDAGGDATAAQPILSPAAFFVDQTIDRNTKPSPLPVEYLAVMLDRFTTEPPATQKLVGLVNVNTAPRPVLRTLTLLTEQQIDAILEVREGLSAESAATPAWLVTSGAVDINTFEKIAHLVTARGQQFMVESVGFADHTGMVTRLQVILDMVGPVAQTVYYRDLSQLGGRFPIREEDQKRSSRGR